MILEDKKAGTSAPISCREREYLVCLRRRVGARSQADRIWIDGTTSPWTRERAMAAV
jgi:hypothetical protein